LPAPPLVRNLMLRSLPAMLRGHAGNAGWSVLEQGAQPALQLLLTPFLLLTLGRDAFAVWALGMTLLSLSQLVSFGAGFATIKHVSADLGAGQPAADAVRAALAVALGGGLTAALLASLLAPRVAGAVFPDLARTGQLVSVLALCGWGALVNEVDTVLACALRGAQRFDLAARTEALCRIIMVLAIAWLGMRGAAVAQLFGAWILLMAVKAAVKATQVARMFGAAAIAPSPRRAPLQRLLRFGGWQWLQSAGTVFFTSADQLLVGSLLGSAALTRYSVCLQLAQYVHLLPSVMLQVIFPRISARGAALEPARANQILTLATLLGVSAAAVLALPLLLFASPLLTAWVGSAFAAENSRLLSVLVLVHVVLAANIGGYYVLLATGRAARSALVVLGAGVAQIAAIVLAAPFGLLAVAASRFLYSLLTASLFRLARLRA
jgi:O-antigen/teichoic acid export membrane protein